MKASPPPFPQPASLSHEEEKLYLREEALVSLSPRIRALSDSIGTNHRARYDYVLSLMEYDKTVPGWGNGDSERACDVRKGNCTDYHSLFMSLCRAQGVPAVFEMGYPTKPEGEVDRTGGYHCWAWFYRDGAWLSVDISEADKNPEKTDFFFGNLDPDRISFSRGRDVKLPGMQGPALNYLPSGAYVEVDPPPVPGSEHRIIFTLPDFEEFVVTTAVARWNRLRGGHRRCGSGFEFVDVSKDHRSRLDYWVKSSIENPVFG